MEKMSRGRYSSFGPLPRLYRMFPLFALCALLTACGDDGTEDQYTVPSLARLEVNDGDEVEAGDALVEGARDPKELLEIRGVRETQSYLVGEVQKVYREQGVSIHDKHIELIVRQIGRAHV